MRPDQTSPTAADDQRAAPDPVVETNRLTPAARRALAEAEARRKSAARAAAGEGKSARPVEVGGLDGPDPVRYGDWEKGGIVSDF